MMRSVVSVERPNGSRPSILRKRPLSHCGRAGSSCGRAVMSGDPFREFGGSEFMLRIAALLNPLEPTMECMVAELQAAEYILSRKGKCVPILDSPTCLWLV